MPWLRIPSQLGRFTDGARRLQVRGATVRDAIDSLGPESLLRAHLLTESGVLRQHLHLFLGEEDIRDRLDLALGPEDELYVLNAMSGGSTLAVSTRAGQTTDLSALQRPRRSLRR